MSVKRKPPVFTLKLVKIGGNSLGVILPKWYLKRKGKDVGDSITVEVVR